MAVSIAAPARCSGWRAAATAPRATAAGSAIRLRTPSTSSSRVAGPGPGCQGAAATGAGSGSKSRSASATSTSETPSTRAWCTRSTRPTRPPGRPVANARCQRGLDRSSGHENRASAKRWKARSSAPSPRSTTSTWLSMSNSGSSTQRGRSIPAGTSASRARRCGTRPSRAATCAQRSPRRSCPLLSVNGPPSKMQAAPTCSGSPSRSSDRKALSRALSRRRTGVAVIAPRPRDHPRPGLRGWVARR